MNRLDEVKAKIQEMNAEELISYIDDLFECKTCIYNDKCNYNDYDCSLGHELWLLEEV